MSGKRYSEEFKIEAVKQVTDRGYKLREVAERLGVTIKSLYDWRAARSWGHPELTFTNRTLLKILES